MPIPIAFCLHCLVFLLLPSIVVHCSPPPDPIHCLSPDANCTVTNMYGAFPDRSTCHAAKVVYPTSEAELIATVAHAVRTKTKIKAVSHHSNSIPKLVCPDGTEGLLVSTRHLDRVVAVDAKAMTMAVEGGMRLRELIDAAAEHGMALLHSPYWWGVTIGGLLSTGAHGSSVWGKGGAVHEYVVGLRMVTPAPAADGYAVVRALDASSCCSEEFDAARVSLGVLGVISQVTLKLEPMFKRSITNELRDDWDLARRAARFGKEHEFAAITWLPGQRKALYTIDDRVDVEAPGNGLNDFLGFRPQPTLVLAADRISEEAADESGVAAGKCLSSRLLDAILLATAKSLSNNGVVFTGYPVVGFQNRIQSSGGCLVGPEDALLTACPWDPRVEGLFFHQTAVNVPLRSVPSFVVDVQRLRDLEPEAFCEADLYGGVLMRYVGASGAHLGVREDSVSFDFTYYRSRESGVPRVNGAVFEEVEQMALRKYGGRPHWGKNRNVAFDGVAGKYRVGEFLKVKGRFDPLGLFSSEWTDGVLGVGGRRRRRRRRRRAVVVEGDGCALEGLCVCSEDRHCLPEKGWVCEGGRVYEEARVCRRRSST